jgi:hypothetical protein
MITSTYSELAKYNTNGLFKIALLNDLFDNSYYISKRELLQCFHTHMMADSITIPDDMALKYFTPCE